MKNKKSCLLFAAFLVITAVMPILAGSSTPMITHSSSLATPEQPSIATIETMLSYVDAWGGVTNLLGSFQNASHYGYTHVQALEDVITNQMENQNGYVSMAIFTFSGLTPFPNGAVGPPSATLQLTVQPVLEVPADPSLADFTGLSRSSAIDLALEVVEKYETALSIELERFMTVEHETSTYFEYDEEYSESLETIVYEITYMALMDSLESGEVAMNSMRNRVSTLGGFMDLLEGSGWPDAMTSATELYIPSHFTASERPHHSFVGDLYSGLGKPYIRADPSHIDLQETVNSGILSIFSFDYPGAVMTGVGNETYSLADHVDYTGNIQNKMQQDDSAESISIIGGAAPAHLTIDGIPTSWITVDDSFEVPEAVSIPGGPTLPENSTVSEIIQTALSHMPRQFAYELNNSLGKVNTTMLDVLVDNLWAIGPSSPQFPDIETMVTNVDFSDMPETPITDMNFDLLAKIMESAGLNPDALIERIDEQLANDNPAAAILKAFVNYFDTYGILHILDDDVYADPVALEEYLNEFGDGVEQFLKDFAGVDLPAEFQDKEAIAAFLEEHWDIMLQALWNAMGGGDMNAIKDALHNLVDSTKLQETIVPYFMADLGSSLIGGIGFSGAINLNFEMEMFAEIDADSLALTFDADPEAFEISGPYLAMTKYTPNRTIDEGDTIPFTITVHNYGDEDAYNLRVLDGMSSGLDGERDFLWKRATLAADETWTISYSVEATDSGLYMDMPAYCVYFNTTLDSFNPTSAEDWDGSARYTMTAPGYQILIQGTEPSWLDDLIGGEIMGIPTLYLVAGAGGIAVIGVALMVFRRR